MKKVILDENLPVSLRHHLSEFEVVTVQFRGWAGFRNGDLIELIDGEFDVFLTADQNLRYQQNLRNRRIAIIELPFIRRQSIQLWAEKIRIAIHSAQLGDYIQIPSDR